MTGSAGVRKVICASASATPQQWRQAHVHGAKADNAYRFQSYKTEHCTANGNNFCKKQH